MASLHLEKYVPHYIAIGAGVVAARSAPDIAVFPNSFVAGTMTFGIVVAGFTATQRTMLMDKGGTRVIKWAIDKGQDKNILSFLRQCILASLFVVIVTVIGFFVPTEVFECSKLYWGVWLFFWTGGIVLVIALLVRNELLMFQLAKRLMKEPPNKD